MPYRNFDSDMASAYGWVLVSVSSLVSRGYGIHRNVIAVHAKTLKEATYALKLANQTTEKSYQHCTQFSIRGVGQGTADVPSIFLFISSQLFKAHSRRAHIMMFRTTDGAISLHIIMIGFVDNTTVITSGFPQDPIKVIPKRMQYDADLWNRLSW